MIFWQQWRHWNWRSQIPGVHNLCWKLLAVLLLFGFSCRYKRFWKLMVCSLGLPNSYMMPIVNITLMMKNITLNLFQNAILRMHGYWILLNPWQKIILSAMWKVIWKYNFIKQWCIASLYLTPWVNNEAHILKIWVFSNKYCYFLFLFQYSSYLTLPSSFIRSWTSKLFKLYNNPLRQVIIHFID